MLVVKHLLQSLSIDRAQTYSKGLILLYQEGNVKLYYDPFQIYHTVRKVNVVTPNNLPHTLLPVPCRVRTVV